MWMEATDTSFLKVFLFLCCCALSLMVAKGQTTGDLEAARDRGDVAAVDRLIGQATGAAGNSAEEASTLAIVVSGPEVSNTLASQLTQTLTAANGPPSEASSLEQLTSDSLDGQQVETVGSFSFKICLACFFKFKSLSK